MTTEGPPHVISFHIRTSNKKKKEGEERERTGGRRCAHLVAHPGATRTQHSEDGKHKDKAKGGGGKQCEKKKT